MTKSLKFAFLTVVLAGTAVSLSAEDKFVTPRAVSPAQSAEIPSSVGVPEIIMYVPGGGEIGIEKILPNKVVEITLDGNPFMTLNSSDKDQINFSKTGVNDLALMTGLLTEPGQYRVTLPKQIVQLSSQTGTIEEGASEEEENYYYNAEYSFTFSIVAMPEYSISPAPGMYQPSDMSAFTVSFPEGSSLNVSSSGRAALYIIDHYNNDSSTVVTYLNATADGNRLLLTAADASKIKALDYGINRQWYYIYIPKNLLTVTLDGKTYHNPRLTFEKYDVRAVGADGFSISPSPAENLLPSDVTKFIISYPQNVTLGSQCEIGSIGAVLKQLGNTEADRLGYKGYNFGDLKITDIDTQAHTITMELKQPANEYMYENNPAKMETAYYCVSIYPRVFVGKDSMNFPGYGVNNLNGCPINGVTLIVNGESTEELSLQRGESFTAVEIFYPFNMTHAATGNITLKLGNNVISTISTSKIKLPANGDNYMKVDFGRKIGASGTYTLTIPADVFAQQSYGNYKNLEQQVIIEIGGTSGIDDLEEDSNDAQSEYYTLDGLKVNRDALAPGLYIVRKGDKTSKIVIR